MKRSQPKSPLGSPAVQHMERSKQKKGLKGQGMVAAGGGGKGAAERKAASKAWEASRRPPPPLPPVGPGIEVTPVEAAILKARWDTEMDDMLREGVLRYGAAWGEVSMHMTPHECPREEVEKRWQMVKESPVKGPWSPEEDALLKVLVERYGSKKWSLIATQFPGRSGKQCRERWLNHLDTRVRKSAWTGGEDVVLCEAQGRLGNKWSEISKLLPGRAENAVKNRFNSIITKRLAQQGGFSKVGPLKKGNKSHQHRERQLKQELYQKEGEDPQGTTLIKRQVRKKRAPIGFENMQAYETEWDSSDNDDDDDDEGDAVDGVVTSPAAYLASSSSFNFSDITLTTSPSNNSSRPFDMMATTTSNRHNNTNTNSSSSKPLDMMATDTNSSINNDTCAAILAATATAAAAATTAAAATAVADVAAESKAAMSSGGYTGGGTGGYQGDSTAYYGGDVTAGFQGDITAGYGGGVIAGYDNKSNNSNNNNSAVGNNTRGARHTGTAGAAAAAAATAAGKLAAGSARMMHIDGVSKAEGNAGGSGVQKGRREGREENLMRSIFGLLGERLAQQNSKSNSSSGNSYSGKDCGGYKPGGPDCSGNILCSHQSSANKNSGIPGGTKNNILGGESFTMGQLHADGGGVMEGGVRGGDNAVSLGEVETFRQYKHLVLSPGDMQPSIREKDNLSFSHEMYASSSPSNPTIPSRLDSAAIIGGRVGGQGSPLGRDCSPDVYGADMIITSGNSSGNPSGNINSNIDINPNGNANGSSNASGSINGIVNGHINGNGKVCAAVPTRKAAMEIEAGGGVDVREGQASAITESWSKVQIKAENSMPLRMGVGTRSLAASLVGGAGSTRQNAYGLYPAPPDESHNFRIDSDGSGGVGTAIGGGVCGGEGAALLGSAAIGGGVCGGEGAALLGSGPGVRAHSTNNGMDLFTNDDVIPAPLEISFPGGAGDIMSLSCLGSYTTDVKLRSGLYGEAGFPGCNGRRRGCLGEGGGGGGIGVGMGIDIQVQPMSESSPGGWTNTTSSGRRNNNDNSNARSSKSPSGHTAGNRREMDESSSNIGGAVRRGDGEGINNNAELETLANLSLDDDPAPSWSQLKTDVVGAPGPAFDADGLPMSLMSYSSDALGGAHGFPVPPALKSQPNAARSLYPPVLYPSPYSNGMPLTPGFAASPNALNLPYQHDQEHHQEHLNQDRLSPTACNAGNSAVAISLSLPPASMAQDSSGCGPRQNSSGSFGGEEAGKGGGAPSSFSLTSASRCTNYNQSFGLTNSRKGDKSLVGRNDQLTRQNDRSTGDNDRPATQNNDDNNLKYPVEGKFPTGAAHGPIGNSSARGRVGFSPTTDSSNNDSDHNDDNDNININTSSDAVSNNKDRTHRPAVTAAAPNAEQLNNGRSLDDEPTYPPQQASHATCGAAAASSSCHSTDLPSANVSTSALNTTDFSAAVGTCPTFTTTRSEFGDSSVNAGIGQPDPHQRIMAAAAAAPRAVGTSVRGRGEREEEIAYSLASSPTVRLGGGIILAAEATVAPYGPIMVDGGGGSGLESETTACFGDGVEVEVEEEEDENGEGVDGGVQAYTGADYLEQRWGHQRIAGAEIYIDDLPDSQRIITGDQPLQGGDILQDAPPSYSPTGWV